MICKRPPDDLYQAAVTTPQLPQVLAARGSQLHASLEIILASGAALLSDARRLDLTSSINQGRTSSP